MHDRTVPTSIVDKNGRATTVWKRVQPATSHGVIPPTPPPRASRDYQVQELFGSVQRLRKADDSGFLDKSGLERDFVIEASGDPALIGSSLKDSLRRMSRDDNGIELARQEVEMQGRTRTVYFVGSDLENKMEHFQTWLDEGAESSEHTAFAQNLTGEATEWEAKTVAWISPAGDIAWTLDEEVVDSLVAGITPY